MSSCVVFCGGCFLCAVLILIQVGFFVAYQVTYLFSLKLVIGYAVLAIICAVAIVAVCLCVMCEEHRDTSRLRVSTLIWVVYVSFGVVPSVIAIWVFVVDAGLDKSSFLGPNLLKGIMCITPFVLLLMTNTTEDEISEQRRERLWHMSFQIAVDLFDVTEMLHAILEAQEQEIAISRNVRIGMTVIACFAYLLPSFQMEETKILKAGQAKTRFKTTLVRNVFQMIGVNLPLLIFRLTLKSWKNESIFISKNIIGIAYSFWKMCKLCWKCILDEDYDYRPLASKPEVDCVLTS